MQVHNPNHSLCLQITTMIIYTTTYFRTKPLSVCHTEKIVVSMFISQMNSLFFRGYRSLHYGVNELKACPFQSDTVNGNAQVIVLMRWLSCTKGITACCLETGRPQRSTPFVSSRVNYVWKVLQTFSAQLSLFVFLLLQVQVHKHNITSVRFIVKLFY